MASCAVAVLLAHARRQQATRAGGGVGGDGRCRPDHQRRLVQPQVLGLSDRRGRPAEPVGQGPGRGHRHLAAPRRRGRRRSGAGRPALARRSRLGPCRVLPRDRRLAARAFRRRRRCSASVTASCMAASTMRRRCASIRRCSPSSRRSVRWRPLHQPHNLAGIRAVAAVQPDLPQVACFDTAFHRSHPELADWFALPRRFYDEGIRRYGFHGLSYEYIASALPEVAPEIADGRVVVAHLGSGASMCAIHGGPERRQHDGLHRARRPADGHPLRRARPGRRAPSDPRLRHGRRRDRAPALPRLRPEGRLRHQQRHARPAGERRSARRARRSICSSSGSAASSARSPAVARRPRRPRVHRRDRRALGRDPRAGLRARRLARHRARPCGQPRRRPAHLDRRPAGSRSTRSRPTRSR